MRMSQSLATLSVIVSIFHFISGSGFGQNAVPTLVNYQGELKSPRTGDPVQDGNYDMVFEIFTAETRGATVWHGSYTAANRNPVEVKDGRFGIILGSGTGNAMDASVFDGSDRWLEIRVGTETLSPKQRITSSAYSLVSENCRLLGGKEASEYVIQAQGLRLQATATSPNIVAGYTGNAVTAGVVGATIGGGGASANANLVTDDYGTIGGGGNNQAGDNAGTTTEASYATVGGGYANHANGPSATVGGGQNNTASGGGTVGGGLMNTASGSHATVPGGQFNAAQGYCSFAAGLRAGANHDGCFVWGDSCTYDWVSSTGNDQFIARASGGVRFYSNSDLTAGVRLNAGAGSWSSISDRALKDNVTPVDGKHVLNTLMAMPMAEWNYKAQDASIRHMGPMAQDFYAAFGLGEDDKHISTVDADGVALAAIQGLYEIMKEKDENISSLEKRNTELERRLGALEELVKKLADPQGEQQ